MTLPDAPNTWGEFSLTTATPDAGKEWTDSGEQRDERSLKHRPEGESRTVPCAPELAAILRTHLEEPGTGPGGRVFYGAQGGVLATSATQRVWDKARKDTLSKEEYASPPAEWAGNSVEVLHRTYEKCLVGHDEIAMRRISEALDGKDGVGAR